MTTIHALTSTLTLTEWEPGGKVPAGFTVQEVIIGRDEGQQASSSGKNCTRCGQGTSVPSSRSRTD